jgi:DNA-binding CsgD family transcriptional regulator
MSMLLFVFCFTWQFHFITNPKGVVINIIDHTKLKLYHFLGIFHLWIKKIFVKITNMPLVVTVNGTISHSPLTARERDVLKLWAEGLQHKQIALRFSLSPQTVKKHLQNVYKKLDAHNKVQALTKAGYL